MTEKLPRIEKILFATDFSVYSEKAREFALTLALKFHASVVVVHVIEGLGLEEEPDDQLKEWMSGLEAKVERKMKREIDRFRTLDVAVDGELIWGTPWREIDRLAESTDLVVIGSHGLSKDQPLLGTTSHKVAMTCRKPVLIIRN